MTFIADLAFITSFIGILGFACWDVGAEVPVLYSFGAFLGQWWFHDSYSKGKVNPFNPYSRDGPPAVGRIGNGGSIPFPYPVDPFSSIATVTPTYADSLKVDKDYTPVNGLYGITNVKSDDPTNTDLYIPSAANANDYIARRMLGPHVDWSDLEDMADKTRIYNKTVFKDGTPFIAAQVGANNPDSMDWNKSPYMSSIPGYPFQPPLTATEATGAIIPGTNVPVSVNDYSGMEYYNTYDNQGTNEANYCSSARSMSYNQDAKGDLINSELISAWPGEYSRKNIVQGETQWDTLSSFYDKNYDGTINTTPYGKTRTQVGILSWGTNAPIQNITGQSSIIKETQQDYIITQLSQENPISKLNSSRR